MLGIIMKREHIVPWTRMHLCRVLFSRSGPSYLTPSSAGCITNTSESEPGPDADFRRGAPTANSDLVCLLLQSNAHALIAAEGCAAGSSGPAIRNHCRYARSGGAPSSLRSDMIFGRDRWPTRAASVRTAAGLSSGASIWPNRCELSTASSKPTSII